MFISYKVRIHPNKKQIVKIEKMLWSCSFINNNTIIYCAERIENQGNDCALPKPEGMVQVYRTQPNLKILNDMDQHALKHSARTALKFVSNKVHKNRKGEMEPKNAFEINFHTKSFRLDPTRSKKWIKKKHLKLTHLGKVECKHTDYIPKDAKVSGIVIKKDRGKYYAIVYVKDDRLTIKDTKRLTIIPENILAISLGVDDSSIIRLALSNGNFSHSVDDEILKKCKDIDDQILHLLEIRNSVLIGNGGLVSKRVDQLNHKIETLTEYRENIMRYRIDNIVSRIRNIRPPAIIMESFTVNFYKSFCKNNSEYQDLIIKREWEYFLKRLRNMAFAECINLFVPVDNSGTHSKCHKCGKINFYDDASSPMFHCKHCGMVVYRSINTAINLARCDRVIDVFFDDVSEVRRGVRDELERAKQEKYQKLMTAAINDQYQLMNSGML